MTPGENTFADFHDNLHFKNSRSQVTAVDPKLFFQMLYIYRGNIIFEGYWKNSSSCEDMPFECDHWDKRFNTKSNLTEHIRTHTGERRILEVRVLTPKVHISKNRGFARGQVTPDSPRYIDQACAIYYSIELHHSFPTKKTDLKNLYKRVLTSFAKPLSLWICDG